MMQSMPNNHYIDECIRQVDTCKGVIAYCKEALEYSELEEWERREYQKQLNMYENILPVLEKQLEQVRSFIWAT